MTLCSRNFLVLAALLTTLATLSASTVKADSKCYKRSSTKHKHAVAKSEVPPNNSYYSHHGGDKDGFYNVHFENGNYHGNDNHQSVPTTKPTKQQPVNKTLPTVPSNPSTSPPGSYNPSTPPKTTTPKSPSVPTTPNSGTVLRHGIKHGLSGGQAIQAMHNLLGWWTTWTGEPDSDYKTDVPYMSMCWGMGKSGHDDDAKRFEEFKKIPPGKYKIVAGFNEPDFVGVGSSGPVSPQEAAKAWEQWIAPHKEAGSVLLSPSCALQQNEKWLAPFLAAVQTQPDYINVHVFKDKPEKIKETLDHYRKYGKKMWITELACTNYENGQHKRCDQNETNDFVNGVVQILENDPDVFAYSWSDADNGPACQLTVDDKGQTLTETGNQLKAAFSRFVHNSKRDVEEM